MRMERGILEERCRSGLLWEKLEGILFLFAGIMRKRKGGRRLLDGAQADVATVGRKDGTRRRARRLAAGAVGDAPGDFFFFLYARNARRDPTSDSANKAAVCSLLLQAESFTRRLSLL